MFSLSLSNVLKFLICFRIFDTGLSTPNLQMGFTNGRMGYIWGTLLVYTTFLLKYEVYLKKLLK